MIWIAITAGLVTSGVAAALGRRYGPGRPDAARGLLHLGGAALLVAMGFLAAADGAFIASALAVSAGVAATLDLAAVGRRLTSRLPGRQASTVTPFQNAT